MTKYTTRPRVMNGNAPDFDCEPRTQSLTVYETENQNTGLVDRFENPIFRVANSIGFGRVK